MLGQTWHEHISFELAAHCGFLHHSAYIDWHLGRGAFEHYLPADQWAACRSNLAVPYMLLFSAFRSWLLMLWWTCGTVAATSS